MPYDPTSFLDSVRAAIQPDKLKEAGLSPIPGRVALIEEPDGNGDPSYYVYLIYPKKTSEAALAWEKSNRSFLGCGNMFGITPVRITGRM